MRIKFFLFFFLLQAFFIQAAHTQNKYQSLMWKISGNGMTKPSYIYGTMHISGKMAFHIGDPFYKAIREVDEVGLELEPEAWLEAIFTERDGRLNYSSGNVWKTEYGFSSRGNVPYLKGHFKWNRDIQQSVSDILTYDPALLNYLLFRSQSYGMSADFEENTWLDMHIYQSGKKLGKKTFGLETYAQSTYYLKKARKEELNSRKEKTYDDKDWKEIEGLRSQLEPAYRRQDLDFIDSLNKKTISRAFEKYILVERNKIFVANMDSVMQSGKSIFAGMGCAHLPGEAGVIEALREMGYTVEPYNKGEHGSRMASKLNKQTLKRSYRSFTNDDKTISFSSPAEVYMLSSGHDGQSWISLDIPNSASFFVSTIRSYAGLKNQSTADILSAIDSTLYESIPGSILSKKKITVQGHPGFDLINRTRSGDYQRNQIIVLPESILILRLSAPGDKVKLGYGEEFFSSVKLAIPQGKSEQRWQSPDKSISVNLPGRIISFKNQADEPSSDFMATSSDKSNNSYFLVQRHTAEDPGFIDEDEYELNRMADVFKEENYLTDKYRIITTYHELPALRAKFTNSNEQTVFALFVLQNLNYYAFTAITSDSLVADKYFNSLQFSLPQYEKYYDYQDTSVHFKVQIPVDPILIKKDEDEDEYDWYFTTQTEENIFSSSDASTVLTVPDSPELISVRLQRYHRFSDAEDSTEFINSREKMVRGNTLRIDRKDVQWTETGVIIEHVFSDSGSVRKKWTKQILHNKSMYTLETNYDSILGPSDFLKKVFAGFTPTDTVFPYNHFLNMDDEYLDALFSADSTIQVNARKMSASMDFSEEVAPRIRQILHNMPETEDDEQKAELKEDLTYGLLYDTSAVNIAFIKDEFYKNPDSAYYQMDLLHILQLMKTSNSMRSFRQLLIDEPPVVDTYSIQQVFNSCKDSLNLCKLLMPELMSLVGINEYEPAVYSLAGSLMDSLLISPKMIEPLLPQLLMGAKIELKRINAGSGDDPYSSSNVKLLDYCRLLQPFRKKPEVAAFFEKAYASKKNSLLTDLVEFDLQHKVPVADTVLQRIATKDLYRQKLYSVLYQQDAAHLFPKEYNSAESLLAAYIRENYKNKYDKTVTVDSVEVFLSKDDNIRGDKVKVYYCKYKRSDSKQWKGVVFMFDASDVENLWPQFIESYSTIILADNEDEIEEMDLAYKQLIERNRMQRNFGNGYDQEDYDWY